MPKSPQDDDANRPDIFGTALLAAIALSTSITVATASYAPPATGEMGVVFPPWVDEATAITTIVAAGGKIVAPSRFSNIVVAYAEDERFRSNIMADGAWFLTAATGLCAQVKEASS